MGRIALFVHIAHTFFSNISYAFLTYARLPKTHAVSSSKNYFRKAYDYRRDNVLHVRIAARVT